MVNGRGWMREGSRWVSVAVTVGIRILIWGGIGIAGSFSLEEGGGILNRGRFLGGLRTLASDFFHIMHHNNRHTWASPGRRSYPTLTPEGMAPGSREPKWYP